MTTITLSPVIIWYAVSPTGVEIRVRSYANTIAVKEESISTNEGALTFLAQKAGRTIWNEADIVSSCPDPSTVWGGSAPKTLLSDIAIT